MPVVNSSDQSFADEIKQHDKVIVKYYADWCGSCKLFSPKFRRLSEDERFKGIVFLDINAEHSPEARKMANVDTLPFFASFRNGELLEAKSTSKEETVVEMLGNL